MTAQATTAASGTTSRPPPTLSLPARPDQQVLVPGALTMPGPVEPLGVVEEVTLQRGRSGGVTRDTGVKGR